MSRLLGPHLLLQRGQSCVGQTAVVGPHAAIMATGMPTTHKRPKVKTASQTGEAPPETDPLPNYSHLSPPQSALVGF